MYTTFPNGIRLQALKKSRGISPIKNGYGTFQRTAVPRPRIVNSMAHSRKTEKFRAAETWGVGVGGTDGEKPRRYFESQLGST